MSESEREDQLVDALQVLLLTPSIRKFLALNDPKALRQANLALASAGHADCCRACQTT